MKLGIMQPYFFPYLGYFELIAQTDQWVVFDVVQYNAKSWMNRNRILHPSKGWQYITVPVEKAHRGTPIRDIIIKDKNASRDRILGQLEHYKKQAPYYRQVIDLVRAAFNKPGTDRLVDLNVAALSETCSYLGIRFDWSLCSEMDLDLSKIDHPGQWALRISQQLGATEYINPIGGRSIFDLSEWEEANISLTFKKPAYLTYNTYPYEFIESLSILDVLMWNDPKSLKAHEQQNATIP